MRQIIFFLSVFTILMGYAVIAYSNGTTAEVVVFGDPSVLPRDAEDKTIPATIRVFNRPTYSYLIVSIESPSMMPGYSVNYPIESKNIAPDLELRKRDNSEVVSGKDRWEDLGNGKLKYTLPANYATGKTKIDVSVKIFCHDYGAFGKLKAELYERDGGLMSLSVDTGTVPRDENTNHIPDGYCDDFFPADGYIYVKGKEEKEEVDVAAMKAKKAQDDSYVEDYHYSVPDGADRQDTVDADTGPPVNAENGDSLTNFEEFRGIMLGANKHKRFDPRTKDVFYVCHDGGDTLQIDNVAYVRKNMHTYGYGNVTHPNITFYKMHKDYLNDPFMDSRENDGWINTNSDDNPDIDKTYAIRIIDWGKHTDGATLGACPRSRPFWNSVAKIYGKTIEDAKNDPTKRYQNVMLDDLIKSVIAHEVAHAINLHHCPLSCLQKHKTCIMRVALNYKNNNWLDENGDQTQVTDLNVKATVSPEHYVDYDLAGKNKIPQHPADDPKPRGKHPNDKPKKVPPEKLQSTLTPSDDVYTASAGDSHTSNFSTDSPYTSVHWYVKPPGDTSDRGSLIETDTGDGSATTASLSYTFAASAVAGAYIITAYVTTPDGVYEVSYTVTIPTVPGTPSVGVIGIMGDDRIYLSWRKPSDDGGAAITDYEYRYRIVGSTDEGTWTSGGMDFNETVSGLSTDTIYEIEVRAKNSVGYSDASTSVSFYTRMTKTVPSAPRALSAVAGDGSVELSWQPPENDGNSRVLRYEYRYGIGELATVESYTSWASMGSAMAKYPVSPLTNDMYHIFEVRAVNAIGNSLPSAAANATPTAPTPDPITPPDPPTPTPDPSPPTSAPNQPTGLSVVSTSNGTVELSWSDPEGGGVNEYEYRVDPNNDGSWNDWKSLKSSATSARLMLQNGRTYGIQVRAKNSLGSGIKSTKVTAMPVDSSVSTPSAPRNLTATAANGQVKLSWNAPSTGSGIIDYEYRLDTHDDGSWQKWKITNSTSTSYTVSGLTNDTVYAFKVRARNAGGIGTASSKVTATPINITVPPKPRNLTAAMTTDDRIKLDWDAPLNTGGSPITDYEYRYDTDNDGSWTSWRSTGDTNTYEYFRGFSDETTYAYQIRAENKVGAGPASNKAVITTPPGIVPPSIPLTFSAAAGHASVSLSWQAPTDDGGESSIAYQYRYKKSGTAYTGWSAEQSSLFANITGLTADSVYRFELRAKNSAGHSPIVIATAIPKAPTVPGKPTGLSVVSTSNGTVKISWSAPENDGGDSIGDYEYRIDPNNDGTWNDWESLDSNSTSATLNLQNGRNYGIEVRAKNSVGKSVKSTKVSAMPIDPSVSTPSAPRNLTATAGNRQVRLSWNTPSTSNGIIDYEYRLDTDDDGSWRKWKVIDSTSTAYTVTGLTNETTYAFLIRARNAGGAGSQSTKVTATPTNITVPGAPRNLTVSGIDRTTVFLDWDAPVDTGGSPITDYRYHIDTHNDGSWEELDNLSTTSTSANLYRFNPGETYAFMVSAVNEVGAGTTSNIAVITMQSISPPSAPQYLSADAGHASVYLSWSYPADDGGGYVDYQYRYRQSGGTWSSWSAEQWESYVTVTSLTNGTSYEFEVVATNEAGMGTAATVSATPTGSAVPGVPLYFDTHSENGAVELWWDPPDYDGGSPITDYEYNYRQSGGSWNGWSSAGNANVDYPEYTVTGLTNGTTYQFKVRAKNNVGAGESTSVLSETPNAKKPDTPTGLSASAGTTTGSIDLTWTAPNDNGSPITGYKFTYGSRKNNRWVWTDLASTGSISTSYTVTGLASGTSYRFRVVATNSVGNSSASKYAAATAP